MEAATEIEDRVDTLVRQLVSRRTPVRRIVSEVEALRQRYLNETDYSPDVIERSVDLVLELHFPTGYVVAPVNVQATRQIDAAKEDANRQIAQSSGFQSGRVIRVFERSINPSPHVFTPSVFATYLYDGLGIQYRDEKGKLFVPSKGEISPAVVRLRNASPQELHQFFLKLIQIHGYENFRNAMWQDLGDDISLRTLVGDFGIYPPINSVGAKKWEYVRVSRYRQEPGPGANFSRYVFDRLFDQYVAHGGEGDIQPTRPVADLL